MSHRKPFAPNSPVAICSHLPDKVVIPVPDTEPLVDSLDRVTTAGNHERPSADTALPEGPGYLVRATGF